MQAAGRLPVPAAVIQDPLASFAGRSSELPLAADPLDSADLLACRDPLDTEHTAAATEKLQPTSQVFGPPIRLLMGNIRLLTTCANSRHVIHHIWAP